MLKTKFIKCDEKDMYIIYHTNLEMSRKIVRQVSTKKCCEKNIKKIKKSFNKVLTNCYKYIKIITALTNIRFTYVQQH